MPKYQSRLLTFPNPQPPSHPQGINLFLDGYVPSENFRFRTEPLDFDVGAKAQVAIQLRP